MAPKFLKQLRRRSKASFRTEASTDTSSDGAVSHGTAPSSGSVTPPSIAHHSDPALNLQLKDSGEQLTQTSSRPALPTNGSNASRYSTQSVPGVSGTGSPRLGGKSSIPLSKYAPRIHNLNENSWVCTSFYRLGAARTTNAPDHDKEVYGILLRPLLTPIYRCIKRPFCSMVPLGTLPLQQHPWTAQ